MHRSTLAALAVIGLTGAAKADAAKAKKLNVQGMQKYAKGDYDDALALFRAAEAADPTAVLPRYNAASVLSLMGKLVESGTELDALTSSTDPAAAKALAKGKTDPDLERASTEAHVREVLGLPAIASMTPDAILVERNGRWGSDGDACGEEAVTVTFRKNGTLAVAAEFACDATDNTQDGKGTWRVSGKTITLRTERFASPATATFGPCEDVKTAACLQITDADGHTYELRRGAGQMH